MNKFNPEKGTISRIKAHEVYTNPVSKKKQKTYEEAKADGFDLDEPSWEFKNIKGFGKGQLKPTITTEKYFDTKNDGKAFKKKKETPIYKAKKPFYMEKGIKKFHEI